VRGKKGFTLVELIMVIVVLGILAIVAIPKYFDLSSDANTAAEKGVVGGIRAGILTEFARLKTFPTALDTASVAACASGNVCFDDVLEGGVTADWTKTAANTYQNTISTTSYTYTPATGSFQ